MIRCPDNQINASFIDISRIKWLVFLLWSSFFRTTSTVASSEAPADYQPAPGRTDGIPERHQRQWIINPSLQICAWNFNRTGRGIRQKSIHSFHSIHSFPDGSAFCPGAPKRVPSDSEKHRRVYTSSNVCHSHEWRVDTTSGMTLKKQNACLHAVRHAVGKKLCVYTASEVKGLIAKIAQGLGLIILNNCSGFPQSFHFFILLVQTVFTRHPTQPPHISILSWQIKFQSAKSSLGRQINY